MSPKKPDCTGQRFGRLVVLGMGGKKSQRKSYIQLWRLQCDCGNVIEIPRHSFENRGQVSCGCKRRLGLVDNKRRPMDITGQKFGQLTAVKLTGNKLDGKPTWLFECDCGGQCEASLTKIRFWQSHKIRINCRDRCKHRDLYLEYPAIPDPYPQEAGKLLTKYLHLTQLRYKQVDSAVEDEMRDRLLRVCWIIAYRRSQGEQISELYERRIITKWLRFASAAVKKRRVVEYLGARLYTGEENVIGGKMTDATSLDYPAIETLGINILPTKPVKRVKFRRA